VIEIRGAGPVGSVLALLLSRHGCSVSLAGKENQARENTFRPIALSHASRLILERVGAWRSLSPTPIETIHVSQQGAFGRARLAAAEAGVPALGYVVSYADLIEGLLSRVKDEEIPKDTPGEAALVVHAEGFAEDAPEERYPHDAVVALVSVEPAAAGTQPATAGTAWERFTPEGPLALLPFAGRYAVVWALHPERALALAAAPAAQFLDELQQAFGTRAGRFSEAASRARVPLTLRVRASRVGSRAAYVGNSAQALHPVAGQGLNLGLRDAWDLAQVLHDAADPGDARVLARYAAMRRLDAAATVRVTDFLARGFLGASRTRRWIRGIGLTALDTCLPARRFFARRMIYGASALP
jgi:2-octaprenyl-6-methoxyphenol hydroxylase